MTANAAGAERVLTDLRQAASRLMAETGGPLRRIHLRSGDTVLEIEWHGTAVPLGAAVPDDTPGPAQVPVPREPAAAATGAEPVDGDGRHLVLAPMVGTHYRAPEPGARPFIEVGDRVEPGQVVCIVEAMKLMNEVVAERGGRVAEVLVADGEPVEFGQPIIALVPG